MITEPTYTVNWEMLDFDMDCETMHGWHDYRWDSEDSYYEPKPDYGQRNTFDREFCDAEHSKRSIKYKERNDWRLKVAREFSEYRPYWFECAVRRMQDENTLAYYQQNGLMHLYYTNPE